MAANDCIKGFIIGGAIGTILGILCAPKSGKDLRKEIRHSSEELLKKAREQYEQTSQKIEQLANRKKELFTEKKEKVRKAIDAGAEAFKQT
jgi:gas vesicle protein